MHHRWRWLIGPQNLCRCFMKHVSVALLASTTWLSNQEVSLMTPHSISSPLRNAIFGISAMITPCLVMRLLEVCFCRFNKYGGRWLPNARKSQVHLHLRVQPWPSLGNTRLSLHNMPLVWGTYLLSSTARRSADKRTLHRWIKNQVTSCKKKIRNSVEFTWNLVLFCSGVVSWSCFTLPISQEALSVLW